MDDVFARYVTKPLWALWELLIGYHPPMVCGTCGYSLEVDMSVPRGLRRRDRHERAVEHYQFLHDRMKRQWR